MIVVIAVMAKCYTDAMFNKGKSLSLALSRYRSFFGLCMVVYLISLLIDARDMLHLQYMICCSMHQVVHCAVYMNMIRYYAISQCFTDIYYIIDITNYNL